MGKLSGFGRWRWGVVQRSGVHLPEDLVQARPIRAGLRANLPLDAQEEG
jgi:hypothetical protein